MLSIYAYSDDEEIRYYKLFNFISEVQTKFQSFSLYNHNSILIMVLILLH